MEILYTTDKNFFPQVAASIFSICKNNRKSEVIQFHLMITGVPAAFQDKLKKAVSPYGRSVFYYDIDRYFTHYFNFEFDTGGWNPVVLARLFADKALPEDIKRVIYLDGDTIVRGSLEELWQTNLNDYTLGGVIEPTVNPQTYISLGLKPGDYFNAGVLLLPLDKWRREGIGERILEYYRTNQKKLFANDQDALNGSLKNEIFYLSPKFNYCNTYDFYPWKALCKMVAPKKYLSKEEFDSVKNNPVIMHYLGEERPWRQGNHHRFRSDFEKYLAMTPWADMPYEKGWRIYFICFHLFHAVLKPFPMLRWHIITALIPFVMKWRAKKRKS